MKELSEIINTVSAFASDEWGVLATVIDVRGSGYRLPGARMLILADGRTVGTVSGGCLEADVLERATTVLETGRAELFIYDTRDENSVFSMNMGCRGITRILLETIARDSPLVGKFRVTGETRERQVMATVISAMTDADVHVGGRMFLDASGEFTADDLPAFLADLPQLRDACSRYYSATDGDDLQTFEIAEGAFEFIFENMDSPPLIMIFGAGSDAVSMARVITELGWHVDIHDHRPGFLTRERFPMARDLVLYSSEDALGTVTADGNSAAVVMTHNYSRDRAILPALLLSDLSYIGVLGPKRRTQQILEELAAGGHDLTAGQLLRLYAPAGLDIGADTPESIAIAIAGEIQSVIAGRNGSHLRDREGPIYDRRQ